MGSRIKLGAQFIADLNTDRQQPGPDIIPHDPYANRGRSEVAERPV